MSDWTSTAIALLEADANRSADTHLHLFPLPSEWGIDLYLKDESVHPTGSLKHRLARSLILYGLVNGRIREDTTLVESSSGSTAVSEAYFARMLGLPFITVVPRSTVQEKIDLIEFYGHNVSPDANKRNVVIFGEGSADRSPCGTGTSAKLGTLYAKGELKVGEPFIYESFMGTKFKGVIEKEVDECGYKAVIPLITGTAYLTGEATYAIDPIDPLKYGFIVG